MKRGVVGLVALLAALLGGVLLGGDLVLNTGWVRARVMEAVQRATGHEVRLDGPLSVAWSSRPAVAVRGLVVLNPPGFSRPELAMFRRIEAALTLQRLLSGQIEIPSVVIEGADLRLERDAAGRGNWERPPAPPSPAPGPAAPARPARPVEIGAVQVRDSVVAWAGAPPIRIEALMLHPAGGPLTGTLGVGAMPVTLDGIMDPTGVASVQAKAPGVAIAVSRDAAGPLSVEAVVPDLAALSPVLGRTLPSLRDVRAVGRIGPAGVEGWTLTASASDLGAMLPGLTLTALKASLGQSSEPVQVLAQGQLKALPLSVAVTLTGLVGPVKPRAMQAMVQAGDARLDLDATMTQAGPQGRVKFAAPDLQWSGAAAGLALPPLIDLVGEAVIRPEAEGLRLDGLALNARQGDASGDLTIGWRPRPSVRGTLVSRRLDLDDWPAGPPAIAAAPPVAPPPPAAAPPAAPPAATPLLPGRPLPFALLRGFDADLRLDLAAVTWRAAVWRSVGLRGLLQDGILRLDPVQLQAPGGLVVGALMVDAGKVPPLTSLAVRAPGLDAATSAALFGLPVTAGHVDVDLALRAAGADPHAMAATLGGSIGLAVVDGEVDNAALFGLARSLLPGIVLPVEGGGRSRLRCLALRLDATDGQAKFAAFALDTSRLRLEGEGTLDMGQELMALRLRPLVRLGGSLGAALGGGVAVPVRVDGPFRAPQVQADRGVIAPGRFGLSIGGPTPPDPCGPALSLARGGAAGPMPAP